VINFFFIYMQFDTQFFVEVQLRGTGFPGTGSHEGEVMSGLPQHSGDDRGEMRLESDHNFARNSLTACTFQSFVNNQNLMVSKFAAAFQKLSTVGVKASLIDCSEVVPAAGPPVTKKAT
jgi:manganese peroxidase